MYYKIIRGRNQIGGNVVEIASATTKILLDIGKALDDLGLPDSDVKNDIQAINYDAVFISHYHEDHIGLYKSLLDNTPLYMGKKAYDVYKSSKEYIQQDVFVPAGYLQNGKPITIGDLKITPFLCDHSAMDAYMLLVEDEISRLLYTGDFRSNGRKSFAALLNKLPKDIDVLICEGTSLTGRHQTNHTEYDLEQKLTKEIGKCTGPVFVLQAGTNIDRIVTIYKAAKKNRRLYLQDLYMSEITTVIGDSIPNPQSFADVKTYLTQGYSEDDPRKATFEKHRPHMISKASLAKTNFVMYIRPSHLGYLKKLSETMEFHGGLLIYSMWSGYKKKDEFKQLLSFLEDSGVRTIHGHVSGHADQKTIHQLIDHTKAKEVIMVHTHINSGKVGPFFYYKGKVLHDSIVWQDAEDYGEFKTWGNHSDLWDKLEKNNKVSKGHEYFHCPRGRVTYNTHTEVFHIYVNPRLNDPDTIKELIGAFNLEGKTYVIDDTDEHYQIVK